MKLKLLLVWMIFLGTLACQDPSSKPTDKLRYKEAKFKDSKFISSKKYRVYLPLSYNEKTAQNYPVLYMLDGQNLFMNSEAMSGMSWNVHEVADSLANANKVNEFIIVGIEHAGKQRFAEYMPQKPAKIYLPKASEPSEIALAKSVYSDKFLSFLVKELKPHIDTTFRTHSNAANTFIAGSSMGGLCSMYALCEYPQIFGGALCLSSHWTISLDDTTPEAAQTLIDYFDKNIPKNKKWYFDYGTEGLDQYYEPYQVKIDSILMSNNYKRGENWLTQKFEGETHNEIAWNKRLHIPLQFAFGK